MGGVRNPHTSTMLSANVVETSVCSGALTCTDCGVCTLLQEVAILLPSWRQC